MRECWVNFTIWIRIFSCLRIVRLKSNSSPPKDPASIHIYTQKYCLTWEHSLIEYRSRAERLHRLPGNWELRGAQTLLQNPRNFGDLLLLRLKVLHGGSGPEMAAWLPYGDAGHQPRCPIFCWGISATSFFAAWFARDLLWSLFSLFSCSCPLFSCLKFWI